MGDRGRTSRVIVTTMGASVDCANEGLRRLLINSCYFGMGLAVPDRADVDYVDRFEPTFYGFGKFKPGVRPADHRLKK